LRTSNKTLENLEILKKAKILSRFFKTGESEYDEGDIFLGVKYQNREKSQRSILIWL